MQLEVDLQTLGQMAFTHAFSVGTFNFYSSTYVEEFKKVSETKKSKYNGNTLDQQRNPTY